MEQFEVDEALAATELMAVAQGSLTDVKRQVELCLEAGIPARAGREAAGCAAGGCQPKAQLMVRPEDAEQVVRLLQRAWLDAAHREGTLDEEYLAKLRAAHAADSDDPPCPACGHVGPLVGGACGDCGLQLA
jgi:hypothetical protein